MYKFLSKTNFYSCLKAGTKFVYILILISVLVSKFTSNAQARTVTKSTNIINTSNKFIHLKNWVGEVRKPKHKTTNENNNTCTSWNLAVDYQNFASQENPKSDSCGNEDVWNLMESEDLQRNPQTYNLLTSFNANNDYWSGTYVNGNGSFPVAHLYSSNGVSRLRVHPAPNKLAIIGWRSPLNGFISITGGVIDEDLNCGDGVQWFVDKNSTNLTYGGGTTQNFSAGIGGIALSKVAVNMDDMLYFAIHPKGDYYCDTTRVDIKIDALTGDAGIVDPEKSTVTAKLSEVIPGGGINATVEVIALDGYGDPLPNVTASLAVSGDATVAQSNLQTNSQGKATFSITDNTAETVTITAFVNGVKIFNPINLRLANTPLDTPQGYWTFDEKNGTIAHDQGLGDLDAIIHGAASWMHPRATGRFYDSELNPFDLALRFDGTAGLLTIPDGLDPTAYTISIWVRPEVINRNLFVRTSYDGGISHSILIDGSGNFCAYTYDISDWGGKWVCSSTVVNTVTPQWYHIVSTASNNGQLKLYVDGVLEGTPKNIGTLWTDGDHYDIASNTEWQPAFFIGIIGEVRLYDSVLSEADVLELYNPDQSTITVPSGATVANNVDAAEIHITLKDGAGNLLKNHILSMDVSGTENTVAPAMIQTDDNGLASFTVKSTKAEIKTITIFDQTQGVFLEGRPTITFVSGTVSAQHSIIESDLTGVTNDGVSSAKITVTAMDAYGNPVQDLDVDINANGSATVEQTGIKTDSQGKVIALVKNSTPELVTISAVLTSTQQQISQTIDVRFHCQTSGDLVVTVGDTCSFSAGTYYFNSILVEGNSTLILKGDPDTHQGGIINTNSMTINASGVVTVDGQGYLPMTGPGQGSSGNWAWGQSGGAGYGGNGGNGGAGQGGGTYGDQYAPLSLGSGGGNNNYTEGGAGGGAIRLIVSDQLIVNGIISANGLNGKVTQFEAGGGGSGGSIWITADTIAGHGEIKADGGSGGLHWYYGSGGGGGGGRIAIYTNNLSPDILFSVTKGLGGVTAGEDGTIYLNSMDPSLSTVTIEPSQVVADETSTGIIVVTLKNSDGIPVPGREVEITLVSGLGLSINNQYVTDQYVTIGNTDSNGVVTAALTSTKTGLRTLKARSGQEQFIIQQGTIEFIAGPVSATQSSLSSNLVHVPADGLTSANITVVAMDANNNPIPEAPVVLSASGNAIVTQPTAVTNAQGEAFGSIVNSAGELVIIAATIDGVGIEDELSVDFRQADIDLSITAPPVLAAGTNGQYQIAVRNIDGLPVQNVSLQVSLPAGFTYLSSNASIVPTQNGQTLTWQLGDMSPGKNIVFTVFGSLNNMIPAGTMLEIQGVLTSATTEESLDNNSATATTEVVDGHSSSVSISPSLRTVNAGSATTYEILINNEGLLADTFTVAIAGLDPSWYSLSESSVNLAPGEIRPVDLTVDLSSQTDKCSLPGSISFSANITGSNHVEAVAAELALQLGPVVMDIYPENNAVSGSKDVLFSWKSDAPSTGILHIAPVGQPEVGAYSTQVSTIHSVTVTGLTRDVTYEWYVVATSECGTTTTPTRQIKIDNAVVFNSHVQIYTIPRDYDQTVLIPVTNRDTVARDVHLIIEESYEDLIVNFRGSGSIDGDVKLLPGETRYVELAFFAQDADFEDYDINAILTSTDGVETVSDMAVIHVNVLFPNDYTIEEISTDPVTNATTYRLTNNGQPITDLNIRAEDPATHLPALVMMVPQIYHARVGTGEHLDFKVIPLYSADQAIASINDDKNPQGILASPPRNIVNIPFELVSVVNNVARRMLINQNCDGNVYALTFDGPLSMALPYDTWYCPNKEHVKVELLTPPFVDRGNLLGGLLQMNFSPSPSAEPHDVSISLNRNLLQGFQNTIPTGQYTFNLNPAFINTGFMTSAHQTISIDSHFDNFAHYQIGTGGNLTVFLDKVTVFVCAHSLEEAWRIAKDLYGLEPAPSTVNVQIELPDAVSLASPNEDGSFDVRAYISDDAATYSNIYSVTAEVEYLDQLFTPKDTFILFDDGEASHGDAQANDRHFNAQWRPRFDGNIRLTVTATTGYGLSDSDTRTYLLAPQPDFEVKSVYIKEIAREGSHVEVWAQIANNGFTVTGPVTVEFRYYNTTADGVKFGSPVFVSQVVLFDSLFGNTFDHGEVIDIKDDTFIAPAVNTYFVEVIIDP